MSTPKKRSTINMNPLNVDVVTETTAGTPKKSPLKAKAVSPDNLSKTPKPTKSANPTKSPKPSKSPKVVTPSPTATA